MQETHPFSKSLNFCNVILILKLLHFLSLWLQGTSIKRNNNNILSCHIFFPDKLAFILNKISTAFVMDDCGMTWNSSKLFKCTMKFLVKFFSMIWFPYCSTKSLHPFATLKSAMYLKQNQKVSLNNFINLNTIWIPFLYSFLIGSVKRCTLLNTDVLQNATSSNFWLTHFMALISFNTP